MFSYKNLMVYHRVSKHFLWKSDGLPLDLRSFLWESHGLPWDFQSFPIGI